MSPQRHEFNDLAQVILAEFPDELCDVSYFLFYCSRNIPISIRLLCRELG